MFRTTVLQEEFWRMDGNNGPTAMLQINMLYKHTTWFLRSKSLHIYPL